MSLDDHKIHEATMTWAETMRLRGYDEKYIQEALKRRAKRDKCRK